MKSNQTEVRFRFGGAVAYCLVLTGKFRPVMLSFVLTVRHRFGSQCRPTCKEIKLLQIKGLRVNSGRFHFAHNPLVPSSTLGGPTRIFR
jgi:hypothetical protein